MELKITFIIRHTSISENFIVKMTSGKLIYCSHVTLSDIIAYQTLFGCKANFPHFKGMYELMVEILQRRKVKAAAVENGIDRLHSSSNKFQFQKVEFCLEDDKSCQSIYITP
ncbi:hypothetical protein DAPPUDRAFT_314204 [Daphnia pulex]|uniref:Uncharacterized protein n=1 Tax=Daphnia pulex TaxID=6669 RepID=E9G4Y4_DAPPU|nr:hypothetical protein DAPPUDRAFT_314204 [Daphnia pulex]|eukprot:EFX85479.1 hypothetical protein DAPPUDRAFT_314204 [Daphnia pulex]